MRLQPFDGRTANRKLHAAEAIRRWLLAELVESYSFPREWATERVQFLDASSDGLFGFALLTAAGDPYLWVAIDRNGRAEERLRAMLEQSPFAQVGICSDGTPAGTRVLRRRVGAACEYIRDIEPFTRPAERVRPLRPLADTAEDVFFEAHSHIRDIDGLHADESLDELCKVLLAKLHDEGTKLPALRREQCSCAEELAAAARRVHADASGSTAPLRLSSAALVKVIETLQDYSLSASSIDVKGRAFQKVLGPAARAGMGQYFTPLPVIRFMVAVAAPTARERVIDPFAGSGHFLAECLTAAARTTPRTDRKRLDAFARRGLHGIEKSDRMVRVALTDMRLHGSGRRPIRCADALASFENYPEIRAESFDLVLTNPPFGSLLGREALARLGHFELGQGRGAVPLEVLGLERCVQLLRPGGRLGIVLPDGVLANRGMSRVREWFAAKTKVRAIVSLPVETFTPYGANIKTSIVFARKLRRREKPDCGHAVCLARVDNIGYEATGRPCAGSELDQVGDMIRQFLASEGW